MPPRKESFAHKYIPPEEDSSDEVLRVPVASAADQKAWAEDRAEKLLQLQQVKSDMRAEENKWAPVFAAEDAADAEALKAVAEAIDGPVPNKTPDTSREIQTRSSLPEETPAETSSRLRSLVSKLSELTGGARETVANIAEVTSEKFKASKEFLAGRANELGARLGEQWLALKNVDFTEKAKKLGKATGESLYKTGEWYRKLPRGQKLIVSGALLGISLTSGGAPTLVTLLSAAKLGQRSLASLSVYTGIDAVLEKRLAEKEKERGFERTTWEKWKKHGIAGGAALAVFSGLPGHALKEGFELAHGGHALEWLHNAMGHGSVVATAETMGSMHPPSLGIAGEVLPVEAPPDLSSVDAASASEVAMQTPLAPETFSVDAVRKLGPEAMLKLVWEQAQGKGIDPSSYPDGSEMQQLLKADEHTINRVVHLIATNPQHPLFNQGDVLGLKAHMTVGPDGHFEITHIHHPHLETPTQAESVAPTEPPAGATPAEAPATSATDVPAQVDAPPVEHLHIDKTITDNHFFPDGIPGDKAQLYSVDTKAEHVFVYGGNDDDKTDIALKYLAAHPKSHVYYVDTGSDGKLYRVPYSLGRVTKLPIEPVNRISGIFSSWKGVTGPKDFRHLIK